MIWYLYAQFLDIERQDADIFKYFDDSAVLFSSFQESPRLFLQMFLGQEGPGMEPYFRDMFNWDRSYSLIQINDNRTMIRLHALMHFVSGGNIHVHTLLFNLLSFIGLIALFKGFRKMVELPAWLFVIACILPPSLLLWGSGLLKETLVMLPLGLTIYGAVSLYSQQRGGVILLLGLLIFLGIKPYVLVAVLPLLLYLVLRKILSWSPWWTLFSSMGISAFGLVLSSWIPKLDIIGILALKRKDFVQVAELSNAGSAIDIPEFSTVWEFILHSPGAIFRTLFRPGLWEITSILDAMAAIENSLYILLLLLAIWFRRRSIHDVLAMSLCFILGLSILIGSVTPVLGAVVRYKVPALPFLILALYVMMDKEKLKKLKFP